MSKKTSRIKELSKEKSSEIVPNPARTSTRRRNLNQNLEDEKTEDHKKSEYEAKWSLVLWEGSRDTSVVETRNIRKTGEGISAKWENKYYEVKILDADDDKEYLLKLRYNQDGSKRVGKTKPPRISSLDRSLLDVAWVGAEGASSKNTIDQRDKRERQREKSAKEMSLSDLTKKHADLMKTNTRSNKVNMTEPAPQSDVSSDESNEEVANGEQSKLKGSQTPAVDSVSEDSDSEEALELQMKALRQKLDEKRRMKSNEVEGKLSEKESRKEFLKRILSGRNKIMAVSDAKMKSDSKGRNSKEREAGPSTLPPKSGDQEEIFPGTGVFCDRDTYADIILTHRNNAGNFACALMKAVMGADLIGKCAKGRGGKECIPPNIFNAVQTATIEFTTTRPKLTPLQFREKMSQLCSRENRKQAVKPKKLSLEETELTVNAENGRNANIKSSKVHASAGDVIESSGDLNEDKLLDNLEPIGASNQPNNIMENASDDESIVMRQRHGAHTPLQHSPINKNTHSKLRDVPGISLANNSPVTKSLGPESSSVFSLESKLEITQPSTYEKTDNEQTPEYKNYKSGHGNHQPRKASRKHDGSRSRSRDRSMLSLSHHRDSRSSSKESRSSSSSSRDSSSSSSSSSSSRDSSSSSSSRGSSSSSREDKRSKSPQKAKHNKSSRTEDRSKSPRKNKRNKSLLKDKRSSSREDKRSRSPQKAKHGKSSRQDKRSKSSRREERSRSPRRNKHRKSSHKSKRSSSSLEDKRHKISRKNHCSKRSSKDKRSKSSCREKRSRSPRGNKRSKSSRREERRRSPRENERSKCFSKDERSKSSRKEERSKSSCREERSRSPRENKPSKSSIRDKCSKSSRREEHSRSPRGNKRSKNSYRDKSSRERKIKRQ